MLMEVAIAAPIIPYLGINTMFMVMFTNRLNRSIIKFTFGFPMASKVRPKTRPHGLNMAAIANNTIIGAAAKYSVEDITSIMKDLANIKTMLTGIIKANKSKTDSRYVLLSSLVLPVR